MKVTHTACLIVSLALLATGCSNNKGVEIPNNTAAAAVPPSPQVMGGSAGSTDGKPGFAK